MKAIWMVSAVLAASVSMAACARAPAAVDAVPVAAASAQQSMPDKPVSSEPDAPRALPVAVVHKSPTCGCCSLWITHLQQAGFDVEARDTDDLNPLKERLGVPYGKGSCHTAEIGGYVVEGHVPASDIKRLLRERPRIRGLVLPGMPMGSPGMEVPDGSVQPYTVEQVNLDGTTAPYASHSR